MTETSAPRRTPTGRSPSYPGIPLRQAIERARLLYEKERQHFAPMRTITAHWGYKSPASGPASVSYAALKKFGLLEEQGSGKERQGRLTPLAMEILRNPNPEQAIQQAALAPPIHQDMWAQYGEELPSDENLVWGLVQRGFTDTGAKEFVRNYRATIDFAQPDPILPTATDAAQSDPDDDENRFADSAISPRREIRRIPRPQGTAPSPADDESDLYAPGRVQHRPTVRGELDATRIPIPLVGGSVLTLEGTFPVSDVAWQQFLAVLNAMKPGLVSAAPDDVRPASEPE